MIFLNTPPPISNRQKFQSADDSISTVTFLIPLAQCLACVNSVLAPVAIRAVVW